MKIRTRTRVVSVEILMSYLRKLSLINFLHVVLRQQIHFPQIPLQFVIHVEVSLTQYSLHFFQLSMAIIQLPVIVLPKQTRCTRKKKRSSYQSHSPNRCIEHHKHYQKKHHQTNHSPTFPQQFSFLNLFCRSLNCFFSFFFKNYVGNWQKNDQQKCNRVQDFHNDIFKL